MNQHVGNIIVDKRIKERRSFTWEPYIWTERRETIIKAGRRSGQERKPSFWREAWLAKPEVPGIK